MFNLNYERTPASLVTLTARAFFQGSEDWKGLRENWKEFFRKNYLADFIDDNIKFSKVQLLLSEKFEKEELSDDDCLISKIYLKIIVAKVKYQLTQINFEIFNYLKNAYNDSYQAEISYDNGLESLRKFNPNITNEIKYYHNRLINNQGIFSQYVLNFLGPDFNLLQENSAIIDFVMQYKLWPVLEPIKKHLPDRWLEILKKQIISIGSKIMNTPSDEVFTYFFTEICEKGLLQEMCMRENESKQISWDFKLFLTYANNEIKAQRLSLLFAELDKAGFLKDLLSNNYNILLITDDNNIRDIIWQAYTTADLAKEALDYCKQFDSFFSEIKAKRFNRVKWVWQQFEVDEQKNILGNPIILETLIQNVRVEHSSNNRMFPPKTITAEDIDLKMLNYFAKAADKLNLLKRVLSTNNYYIVINIILADEKELALRLWQVLDISDHFNILEYIRENHFDPVSSFEQYSPNFQGDRNICGLNYEKISVSTTLKMLANMYITELAIQQSIFIVTAENQKLFLFLMFACDRLYTQSFKAEEKKSQSKISFFSEESNVPYYFKKLQEKGSLLLSQDLRSNKSLEYVYEIFQALYTAKKGLLRYDPSAYFSCYSDREDYRLSMACIGEAAKIHSIKNKIDAMKIKEIYNEIKRCVPLLGDWDYILNPLLEKLKASENDISTSSTKRFL